MIIRLFQENDQKAVEEISAMYWTDPEFLKELSGELHSYISNPEDSAFFVAEENGEVMGIVGFRKIPDYLMTYRLGERR